MAQEKKEETVENLNNIMQERRDKLNALREQGQAYPNDFHRDATSGDVRKACGDKDAATLESENHVYTIAGRLMTRRIMGKASFATLQDVDGRIQIYVSRDDLPEGDYQNLFKKLDLGDIIGVSGKAFKTKTGELSIHVKS